MHRFYYVVVIVLTLGTACSSNHEYEEVNLLELNQDSLFAVVNPFIGTGGHGHTFPGATLPFGMVQLSPDTRLEGWDGCGGYHDSDNKIYGFSHTHLSGTGVSDYGDVLIMPTSKSDLSARQSNPLDFKNETFASTFKKASESAHAGYYKVHLDDGDIDVELTSGLRVGFHRYTFPEGAEKNIIVDLAHRDEVLSSELTQQNVYEISGKRVSRAWAEEQHVYFHAKFNHLIQKIEYIKHPEKEGAVFAHINFAPQPGPLEMELAISAVDTAGALKNLQAETMAFDTAKVRAQKKWNKVLNKIQIKGGTKDEQTIFYTALYHSFIAPNIFSDDDGRYRGMDKKIHKDEDSLVYTVFSLWDTYRTTHPLYTIIEQDGARAFLETFLKQYQQGGKLPVWELAGNETNCMIGYHSASVITDAYMKGIKIENMDKLLEGMIKSASADDHGLASYKKYGYIRAGDDAESVSKTLEYAYDDYCIYLLADKLGKVGTANAFKQRAHNYKNVFDPSSGFMRAKMSGTWFGPFDPAEVNYNYTEANAWQYSLYAPQDIPGLIALKGGNEAFEQHLDDLFTADSKTTGREQADITGLIGQYAHGNEPSHHTAYLYNYIGKPWKTQERVSEIMNTMYQNAPDGLSGNEDCGQMSSWYVMSALGLYPVTPGIPVYETGIPKFPAITINLENGNSVFILTRGEGDYVKNINYNDSLNFLTQITHKQLMEGGTFVYELGTEEEVAQAVEADTTAVYRALDSYNILSVPYFESEKVTFTDQITVKLGTIEKEPIYYQTIIEGQQPSEWKKYTQPLQVDRTTTIRAHVQGENSQSHTIEETYYKVDGSRKLTLNTPYANQYAAGGKDALIDNLRGAANYRTGRWQGYQGQDLEAVVDLGASKPIKTIGIGVLQDVKSWVFYPPQVDYYVSDNNTDWKKVGTVKNTFPDTTYGSYFQTLSTPANANGRYVKVVAKNYGDVPQWHMGAGGKTWLFADEIIIE